MSAAIQVQKIVRPSDQLNDLYPDLDLLTSSGYFKAVTNGVSGEILKKFVTVIEDRDVFARVLDKDKSNLSKSYRVDKLPKVLGDSVLDTVRVYMQAADIYGSLELASEWLHTPIPALGGEIPVHLMDSHAGRELVRQTLRKIEYGEYS
jgi:putative toxin-antitoxin system antitoxin component (TIGR02293 family)